MLKSILSVFVSRLIFAAPGLIIIGIIMLFIDPRNGEALLVVGFGLIILIAMIVLSKKQKKKRKHIDRYARTSGKGKLHEVSGTINICR